MPQRKVFNFLQHYNIYHAKYLLGMKPLFNKRKTYEIDCTCTTQNDSFVFTKININCKINLYNV